MAKRPTPTKRELAILSVLWDRGEASVREVFEALRDELPIVQNTVQGGAHDLPVDVDQPVGGDGLANGHPVDHAVVQPHHLAPAVLGHQVHGGHPEAGGEHAVHRYRRASALNVAEHRVPHLSVDAAVELGHGDSGRSRHPA